MGEDSSVHTRMREDSIVPFMSETWKVSEDRLRPLTYSLPRGRVSKGPSAFYVTHGGDAPIKDKDILFRRLCREFNLSRLVLNVKFIVDEHHHMLRSEARKLDAILGLSRAA